MARIVERRVTKADIQAKLRDIQGDVDETTDAARPFLPIAIAVGAVLVLGAAYLLGRRQGQEEDHLCRDPPGMNLNRLIALGIRKGWRQGILGGNRTWLLIGAVALSARTVSRLAATRRDRGVPRRHRTRHPAAHQQLPG